MATPINNQETLVLTHENVIKIASLNKALTDGVIVDYNNRKARIKRIMYIDDPLSTRVVITYMFVELPIENS